MTLLTSSYGSLHQTALEAPQQSLLHVESPRTARHRYDHLGLVELPAIRDEFPRVSHGRVLGHGLSRRVVVRLGRYVLRGLAKRLVFYLVSPQ